MTLLKQLNEWWKNARYASGTSRHEQSIDTAFYDGDQWSEEDKQAMAERGQAPLVLNEIAPTVNWLIGTERRTRLENHVIPVTGKPKDTKAALAKSKLVKYLNDSTYAAMETSRAFKDALVSGVGWVELGIHTDPTKEQYFIKYADWRDIWFDAQSTSPTLSDCRYVFRAKWLDLDIAKKLYPNKAEQLERMVNQDPVQQDSGFEEPVAQDMATGRTPLQGVEFTRDFAERKMVRIVEAWYREPADTSILRKMNHPKNGCFCDTLGDDYVQQEVQNGASITETTTMRMKYAVFSGNILLGSGNSPYHHNRFPFVPCFAYRKKKDGMPYGVVRNARWAQEDLNKRHSKSLHLLSTTRVIAEADAASPEGWRAIEDEIARPDAMIRLDGRRSARFDLDTGGNLASQHMEIMQYDSDAISKVAGVTSSNMGQGAAVSSKAVNALHNEGSTVTAELFDNYRIFLQLQGEIQLSLIEQFYDEPQTIMLTSHSGMTSYMDINTEDNITETKAKFRVSQQDFRETMRQSMFDSLMEMLTRIDPQVALNLLDLVVDLSDVPDKDTIVARIRELNGQTPPANEADPNMQMIQQQKQQMKEQQAAMATQEQQAEIDKTNADAKLRQARFLTEQAKARKLSTSADVEAQKHILDASERLGLHNKES